MIEALLLISAYILGSVPFGLVISKMFKNIDIRRFGSGNIGATNISVSYTHLDVYKRQRMYILLILSLFKLLIY